METYKDLLGVKYKENGRSKEEGFDCYGLVIEVLRRNGIKFDDRIKEPKDYPIEHCKKLDNPEINCVVTFINKNDVCYHIAVYLGNGLMIHSRRKLGVCIEHLKALPCKSKEYYCVY